MIMYVSQLMFQEAMDNYECGFSYEGSEALFEHLEEVMDEYWELDPIAIRCEFTEYNSIMECFEQYGDACDIENEEDAMTWLEDRTIVLKLDNGGIIIANF